MVTAYAYIFIYSKHNDFIPQCPFSVVVCTYVLYKHPCLPSCPQPGARSARRIVIELSWFTLRCIHLESSAGRLAMSSWWAETGHEMIIFCPSCSIQKILSVLSVSWRQLICCDFITDHLVYTHIISRPIHFQTTDKIWFSSIKEGEPISLLLVSNFSLIDAEPTESFVQKHIKCLKQALHTSFVSSCLLLSSIKKTLNR